MTAGPARQQGIAALTAILVVTIATVLAVNMLWRTSVDLRRTESLLSQDQARQYDLGGEEVAKLVLAADSREDGRIGGNDTLQETWTTPLLRQFENGTLEAQLTDQQGLFDLNSIVDISGKRVPNSADHLKRLLLLLDLEQPLDPGTAEALVDAAVDWVDADQQPGPAGAEDDRYTNRQPPYRAANFWFVSPSELLAVEGFTPEIYDALQGYVTALPPSTDASASRGINVNTAKDLVLISLLNASGARVEPPINGDFADTPAFFEEVGIPPGENIPPTSVKSSWFLLTVSTSIGTTRSTMYSLLERNGEVVRARLRTFDAK